MVDTSCILYGNSSRTQAKGCQLTHLNHRVNTPISLKYLAGLSVVILKLFFKSLHGFTIKLSQNPSEN